MNLAGEPISVSLAVLVAVHCTQGQVGILAVHHTPERLEVGRINIAEDLVGADAEPQEVRGGRGLSGIESHCGAIVTHCVNRRSLVVDEELISDADVFLGCAGGIECRAVEDARSEAFE